MDVKICLRCGREMAYRKKWAASWGQVKYCSEKCKKQKPNSNYSDMILNLLKQRGYSKSICPSEVLPNDLKSDKILMEQVRSAARLLAHEGLIEITQNNRAVDPTDFKGPIRLRLKT